MSRPQASVTKYGEFLLSSRNRTGGTNNRPSFNLNLPVLDLRSVKLSYASVPRTWYNVNASNNLFDFTETLGTINLPIFLPVGNYTSITFPQMLEAQMTAASLATGNTYTYSVAFDDATLKFTVSSLAAENFSIQFHSLTSSSELTGFSQTTVSGITHTSNNVINLNYTNTILLRGDFGNQTGRAATIFNNEIYNNVVTSIPVTESTGNIIQYEEKNTDYFRCEFTAQKFEFYWSDDQGNLIDFNGVPWNIQISFTHLVRGQ